MTASRFPDVGPLPDTIPIFPLPGALLLPGGRLPLNIFEPRYLNMFIDALGQGRLIGMIQPQPKDDLNLEDHVDLFTVGCVGRITAFSETDDGRLLVTLAGVSRFHMTEELPMLKAYRRVKADFSPFAGDLEAGSTDASMAKDDLIGIVKRYFESQGMDTDWEALETADEQLLVTSLSMVCPFDVREKQALLEAASHDERCRMMTGFMEMASRGPGGDSGSTISH